MIEAEINGKLGEVENKEDVLTSNVFGLLKYIHNNRILVKILENAKNIDGRRFQDCINVDLNKLDFQIIFWKNLAGFGEPDLLIKFYNLNFAL